MFINCSQATKSYVIQNKNRHKEGNINENLGITKVLIHTKSLDGYTDLK